MLQLHSVARLKPNANGNSIISSFVDPCSAFLESVPNYLTPGLKIFSSANITYCRQWRKRTQQCCPR